MTHRLLALFTIAVFACAVGHAQSTAATPAPVAPLPPSEPALEWHDITTWGVEGRAWQQLERKRWFDRLPALADGKVTERVWELSRDRAGDDLLGDDSEGATDGSHPNDLGFMRQAAIFEPVLHAALDGR